MKILIITAYYPPCDYGWGYMRICEQVADGLHERGHQIEVLTSTYRHGEEFKPYPVQRSLHIDPDWLLPQSAMQQFFRGRRQREQADIDSLQQMVRRMQPDVIFVWHAHGLSRAMLQVAEALPQTKVVYYFANYLPELPDEYEEYWEAEAEQPLARLIKTPLAKIALWQLRREGKPIRLRYEHSISVSHYVRDRLRSLIGRDAVVIPNGIDVGMFHHAVPPVQSGPLRCVIAGRVATEKGIHTVLEAMGLLRQRHALQDITLTIVGDGPSDYRQQLEAQVARHGLAPFVTFAPPVPVAEMPQVMAAHQVLLLPSEWDEPLSCTMLEAMSAGLMVIGTTTGGSGEALAHEQTGLTFPAKDAEALAAQLLRVMQERELVPSLAAAAQREVEAHFTIDDTVARIEAHLQALVQGVN
ncbi:MAG: glycosyltransferase family 4 protein [Ardenticatenaceae bacterium]|nr:glycosyltransferase family 4 protein [Ardenticatenaceae bacterium]